MQFRLLLCWNCCSIKLSKTAVATFIVKSLGRSFTNEANTFRYCQIHGNSCLKGAYFGCACLNIPTFIHNCSRWRTASLGSDPMCIPGQWSFWPQKGLDPPVCSTGRQKGVFVNDCENYAFKLLKYQLDEPQDFLSISFSFPERHISKRSN